MEKIDVRRQLPRVGDTRWEVMTLYRQHNGPEDADKPKRCTVIEVNYAHMWYMVQFENGFRECYKLPKEVAPK